MSLFAYGPILNPLLQMNASLLSVELCVDDSSPVKWCNQVTVVIRNHISRKIFDISIHLSLLIN